MLIGMKNQFTNTIEKLKENALRAISVQNAATGIELLCNKTAEEIAQTYGSIEDFFNGLVGKGIKKVIITDKLKNGSTYRKYGDSYEFEFVPNAPQEQQQAIPVQVPTSLPLNAGMNAGLNATIYRDMDYPRIAAELENSKAEVKRLTEENRKLETKILINDTLEGKSIAVKQANTEFMKTFAPAFAPLVEKLAVKLDAPQTPGLNAANLSQVKQHGIKILSGMHDDLVDNINLIMLKANDNQIQQGIMDLADLAEKL